MKILRSCSRYHCRFVYFSLDIRCCMRSLVVDFDGAMTHVFDFKSTMKLHWWCFGSLPVYHTLLMRDVGGGDAQEAVGSGSRHMTADRASVCVCVSVCVFVRLGDCVCDCIVGLSSRATSCVCVNVRASVRVGLRLNVRFDREYDAGVQGAATEREDRLMIENHLNDEATAVVFSVSLPIVVSCFFFSHDSQCCMRTLAFDFDVTMKLVFDSDGGMKLQRWCLGSLP
eukprot:2030246-Rhodomonas_salina.2